MTSQGAGSALLGCAGLLGLWLLCVFGPTVALGLGGPLAGVVGAFAGAAAWIVIGPPPMPGLLPGLLGMTALFAQVGTLVASVAIWLR